MLKRLTIIVAVLIIILPTLITSCRNSDIASENNEDWESQHIDDEWVSPGIVEVGNFYAGAEADWYIRIHAGDGLTTDSYLVTTEPNETVVTITLKQQLLNGDTANITSVKTDYTTDHLKVEKYDGKAVTISGWEQNAKRVINITYRYVAQYQITAEQPSSVREGYSIAPNEIQDWVIIADSTPVLAARETKETEIILSIPKKTVINPVQTVYATAKGKEYYKVSQNTGNADIITQILGRLLKIDENGVVKGKGLPAKAFNTNSTYIPSLISDGYLAYSDLNKWEFQVLVFESSQTANVQKQLASRWIVSMRK